ncbi:hypothetical protein [Streptosporangium sp. NPDC048865]|uniref:hypothetical protein n=1 Tax=Streptosporangium sp. NPDC048865 TaxID=3155766 RepID=UPI0034464912
MRTVEFHGVQGTEDEVARRLFGLPNALVSAPCYMLLLQGAGRAEARIYRRAEEEDLGSVRVWTGEDLGTLPDRLTRMALSETPLPITAFDEALLELGAFEDLGLVPRPVTARGAFGHPLRHYTGELRAYVLAAGLPPAQGGTSLTAAAGNGVRPRWEAHVVAGPRRHVAAWLFALPREVVARERYALLLEGSDGAEIHAAERAEDGKVSMRVARMARLDAALARLPYGADVEELWSWWPATFAFTASPPALAPATPRAAFGLPLDSLDGDVVRAAVLCL